MAGPPRPSFSSQPSEPGLRRLGVRSSTNLERPIRAQVVIALFTAIGLLAVPLYFLRSPEPEPVKEDGPAKLGFAPTVPVAPPVEKKNERVTMSPAKRIRCGVSPGAGAEEGSLCDALPVFEEALTKAVGESADCAPTNTEGGTINHVLRVDFVHKTLHVFPGQSGSWKGPQARRATKCVKQALLAPEWDKITHKHNVYEIAILATYQPPKPADAPLFE